MYISYQNPLEINIMFEELIKAIENYDTIKAKDLINKMSVEDLNKTDSDGRNAFHHAIIKRNINIAKLLGSKCEQDTKIASDNLGKTALHYAQETNDNVLKSLFFTDYYPYDTYSPLISEETSLIGANNLVEAST